MSDEEARTKAIGYLQTGNGRAKLQNRINWVLDKVHSNLRGTKERLELLALEESEPPREGWPLWQIRWDDDECCKCWFNVESETSLYASDFLEVKRRKMETLCVRLAGELYISERVIHARKDVYRAKDEEWEVFHRHRSADKVGIGSFHLLSVNGSWHFLFLIFAHYTHSIPLILPLFHR